MKVKDIVVLHEAINAIKFTGLSKDDIRALLANLRTCKKVAAYVEEMRETLIEKCKPEGFDELDQWIREHAGEKITVEIRDKVNKHRLLSNQYNDSVRLQMEAQLDEDSDFEPATISSDGFDIIIEQECNKSVNPDLLLALSDLIKED